MGKRVHRKVLIKKRGQKRRSWQWCSGRLKSRWSGTSCDCRARTNCA